MIHSKESIRQKESVVLLAMMTTGSRGAEEQTNPTIRTEPVSLSAVKRLPSSAFVTRNEVR
jgi:hypothetical protein